ncbi:MAG: 4Fe-4S binding protein [Lysobacterales bacterium]|nr:MAG: 4Fe-4S binding protein [Xanthomonadales bacterium]
MSALLRLFARCGVNALRTLLLCTLLLGVTASAQAPPDEPAADAAGWNFDEEEEEAAPTLLEHAREQALDIGLLLAFGTLVMVSFLRKSVALKYVTLVFAVIYMGRMKAYMLSVVNVFGVLGGGVSAVKLGFGDEAPTLGAVGGALASSLPPFAFSLAWYAFAVFAVVTTIVWGRVYCGRVCAFGALTQLIDAVVPKRFQLEIPAKLEARASYIKYGILFGAIAAYFVTSEISFYRYIEPFWLFTFDATPVLWTMVGVLLVASIFVRNLYCRFLCPLGAALGLISKATTVLPIKRWSECSQCALCEKTCQWGAIRKRQILKTECVRCDDCEILYDDKLRCPHWLLELKRKARVAFTPDTAAQERTSQT